MQTEQTEAERIVRHWVDMNFHAALHELGMSMYSASRAAGFSRNYLATMMRKDAPHRIALAMTNLVTVSEDVVSAALEVGKTMATRVPVRKKLNSEAYIPRLVMDEPCPCDDCSFSDLCRDKAHACQAFATYVHSLSGNAWLKKSRNPSRSWYLAAMELELAESKAA